VSASNGTLTHSLETPAHQFTGSIYLFHAFDVGDDINFEKIQHIRSLTQIPLTLPKYFKNYHTPLAIELPRPYESSRCISSKIHSFGAISLTYQLPFTDTLEHILKDFNKFNNQFLEQSVIDAKSIFKKIEHCITQPNFFQMNTMYAVVQVYPTAALTIPELKNQYGSTITSMLRFETQSLSEYQKNEILDSAIGYFRGDLIIVDTEATFLYDAEYAEVLDLFEFANIQQLELRFFDRLLDKQLNKIYEGEGRTLPIQSYLPFAVDMATDPVTRLGKIKVDISVITERLESSIKFAGEPYFSELYDLLVRQLDLSNWQHSIDRKLTIIHDIQSVYQNKIDVIRGDLLSVLVIVLIFIELLVGILNVLR
jgi:hypothetical protein